MSVTIDFPVELNESVARYAARNGLDVPTFVLQAVREKCARVRTCDDVCAPLAQSFAAAEVSDDEFDRFFEQARDEVWRERRGREA